MKYILLLTLLILSITPAYAGRCSAGANCSACSNCSACKNCSQGGGTCSVCRPDLYPSSSSSSDSSDSSSSRSYFDGSTSDSYSSNSQPDPITIEEYERREREEREHTRQWERQERAANARVNAALEREARRQAALQSQREAEATRTRTRAATSPPAKAVVAKPAAAGFTGKCVGVSDGDTILVMHLGRAEKIRLYGIDAPEKAQPYGSKAKQFASSAVFGKAVTIYPTGTDRYGRTLGWVFEGKKCLNRDLVEAGLAWHYKQYAPKEAKLAALEAAARKAENGLWSDCCAVPPWEWRQGKRAGPAKTDAVITKEATTDGKGGFQWQILVPIGVVAVTAWVLFRPRKGP